MKTATVLDKIAASVKIRLDERKMRQPESALRALCERARTPHPFKAAFSADGGKGSSPRTGAIPKVIAEIKFSSPSQGQLAAPAPGAPAETAARYLANGATALSVLTEQDHFGGNLAYLAQIRQAHPEALLLLKDFVIDEYQLLEARHTGADAALLIVALLGKEKLASLLKQCRALDLTALVEVHDEEELEIANQTGADLIGVNNRNLKTLEISLDTSFRLAPLARPGTTLIAESGISRGSELVQLTKAGFAGFLIGTSFMKTPDPGAALANLLKEAT